MGEESEREREKERARERQRDRERECEDQRDHHTSSCPPSPTGHEAASNLLYRVQQVRYRVQQARYISIILILCRSVCLL